MTTDLGFFLLSPNGEQTGMFSLYQVKMMQKTGFIGPDTRFWMEGMTEWLPITRIEEFIDFRPPISAAHTGPPKPQTWSGSLARAIPSPNHRPSQPASTVEPSALRKIEVPVVESRPTVPVVPADVPPAAAPEAVGATTPEPVPESVTLEGEALAVPAKRGRRVVSILTIVAVIVLALGAGYWWFGPNGAASFKSVTFPGPNVFVLLDQGSIRPYQGDLANSPMLNDFNLRIAQTDDSETLKQLKTGLDQELSRHRDELQQQYVADSKAQLIPQGKYRVVGYFNEEGEVIAPTDGSCWVAIGYKATVVFAHTEPPATP